MKTVQALTACTNPQKVSLYGMHRAAFAAAGFFVAGKLRSEVSGQITRCAKNESIPSM
jgi:hypothetical protein